MFNEFNYINTLFQKYFRVLGRWNNLRVTLSPPRSLLKLSSVSFHITKYVYE